MDIGIPTEIKPLEGRVALLPESCAALIAAGHRVYMQSGAASLSGYADEQYAELGVHIVEDAKALYAAAVLIVKVKEPVEPELGYLRAEHILFCYLHLAAYPQLLQRLCDIGLTAVGFETVQTDQGALPLLAPMSAIAGRVGIQVGTHLLHQSEGGRGLLLGGITGTECGQVVILGAGVAGSHAASLASAIGANVTVFDKLPERLRAVEQLGEHISGQISAPQQVAEAVAQADLLLGAVLIPGAKAPKLVSSDMIASMRPGTVVVDVSVDQGGCIDTIRPTNFLAPTYVEQGVLHFAVTNMPGAVPRSATQALSFAIAPYVLRLAQGTEALKEPELSRGINVQAGKIVHSALK